MRKCVAWIKENVLREEVVLDILAEVRRQVIEQSKDAAPERGDIEEQVGSLRREIARLAKAVALTEGSVEALAKELTERQARLHALEARLQLLKSAPEVFTLELDRLEERVRERIERLDALLAGDTVEARKVIGSLLDGPMQFKPIQEPEGRRYEVTGRIVTGGVLRALSEVDQEPDAPTVGHADTADPRRKRPQGDSNPR